MTVKKYLILRHAERFIDVLPALIPAVLSSFGAVCIFLLIHGKLTNGLVWPIGLSVALASSIAVLKFYRVDLVGSRKELRIVNLFVLGGLCAWLLFNVQYTSQNVFIYRDPAIYSVAGAWLENSPSVNLPVTDVFGESKNLSATGMGIGASTRVEGQLYAQGLHLLPAFLGLIGRIAGEGAMLHVNPLFGFTALLAIYGFAKLIMKPRWALLVVSILGMSLPFLHFSRDTYTEPLAATFTFGGLALLWGAQRSHKLTIWFLAGLTLGAGTFIRIDAYITLSALTLFLAIYLTLNMRKDFLNRIKESVMLVLGATISSILGWVDLTRLSSGYYASLAPRFKQQLLVLGIVSVLGLIFVVLGRYTKLISWLDRITKGWRAIAAVVIILLIASFMVSRPLWLVSHHNKSIALVSGLQGVAGEVRDPTRDYAEQTANWMAWYIGPAMAILGVVGLAIISGKAARDKDLLFIPVVIVVVGTSFVFMNRPSITPDQVWAARRLVPVIMPGFAIFAGFSLSKIYEIKFIKKNRTLITVLGGIVIIGPPLLISYPFLKSRTYVPQYAQIESICSSLPDKSAVLWAGNLSKNAVHTTMSFCEVPSKAILMTDKNSIKKVSKNTYENGYVPVIAIQTNETELLPPKSKLAEVSSIVFQTMPSSLYHPPRVLDTNSRSISIGLIQSDGSITPIGVDIKKVK